MQDPDQDPEGFRPGTFGCHEALHVAYLLGKHVEEELCDHLAVKQNEAWLELASTAATALWELYQAIGAEHLGAPLPHEKRDG